MLTLSAICEGGRASKGKTILVYLIFLMLLISGILADIVAVTVAVAMVERASAYDKTAPLVCIPPYAA
jgi:hypothetical protein